MRNRISVVAIPVVAVLTAALGTAAAPAANQGAAPAVTFHKDVVPVLQKNCQSCHRPGQIGPFSMLTYKDTRPWAKAIKAAVMSRAMPPWFADPRYGHFNNDRSLSSPRSTPSRPGSMAARLKAIRPTAPRRSRGPKAAGRSSRTSAFDLPPYPVPREGISRVGAHRVPAPFKEDTWVTSVEILPGVPAVVHHLCFGFQKHRAERLHTTSISGWKCRATRTAT